MDDADVPRDVPRPEPPLVLDAARSGRAARLRIAGELDAYSAPALSERCRELLDGGVRDLRVDLRDATFIDSSGLRALLLAHRHLRESGGSLRVDDASEPVRRLLEITGLTLQLGLRPSPDV